MATQISALTLIRFVTNCRVAATDGLWPAARLIADPGRTITRFKEDSRLSVTVELSQCRNDANCTSLPRRPGPVFGNRRGIFQMPPSGKYLPASNNGHISEPDPHPNFSVPQDYAAVCQETPCRSYQLSTEIANPGRLLYRIMEDPNSPDTVVPSLCCVSARSSPVFGPREGVFHHALLHCLIANPNAFSCEVFHWTLHSNFM